MDTIFPSLKNKQGGNRKRVYLFVVDENKLVVNKREQQLLLLKPDFVANGQIMHCAKENVLFWTKKPETENVLWLLPAKCYLWLFRNPNIVEEMKNGFTRDLSGQIIATKTI